MIEVNHIVKTFVTGDIEFRALDDVSFTIEDGEFVAIMGPSGSGKSTLMNIRGALDTPTSGTYLLDGKDVSTMSDDELADIRKSKIGFVFQSFNLLKRAMGADYDRVKDCVKAEPWMGVHHWEIFHKGYRGYGGKCLPKDTRAIIQHAELKGIDLSLLKQAEAYNNELAKGQGLDVQWPEGSPKKN
jgi:ABC-type oligopeptide transport system ATPase subunit